MNATNNFTMFADFEDDDTPEITANKPTYTEHNYTDNEILTLLPQEPSNQIVINDDDNNEVTLSVHTLATLDYERSFIKLRQGQTIPALDAPQAIASYYRFVENVVRKYTINQYQKSVDDKVSGVNVGLINSIRYHHIGLAGQNILTFDQLFFACTESKYLNYIRTDYRKRYLPPSDVNFKTLASVEDSEKISSLTQTRDYIQQIGFYTLSFVLNYQFNQIRQNRIRYWMRQVQDIITPPKSKDTRVPIEIQKASDAFLENQTTFGSIIEKGLANRNQFIINHDDLNTKLKNHSTSQFAPYFEVQRFYKLHHGQYKNQVDFHKGYLLPTGYSVLFSGFLNANFDLSYSLNALELINTMVTDIDKNSDLQDAFTQSLFDSHRHHYHPDFLWISDDNQD